jgi:hypothetical protein
VERAYRERQAEAAAWGFTAGSSLANAYGNGYGSSGYGYGSSDYGSGSGSGYGYGYGSDYGSGTGATNGTTYAVASSTDDGSSRQDAAQQAESNRSQDGDASERAYQAFDRARDAFKAGDYAAALELTDEALKGVPDDPVVHEFKALGLFARGEDAQAADELHTVLAVTAGMDWATLSGLYPDVATYTAQLRALEGRCGKDPKAAAARFVLAYHYLVAGHKDAAAAQLKAVLASKADDQVARRLLASLGGTPPAPPEPSPAVPEGDGAAGRSKAVDLVGRWRGERDGSTFDLTLDDRGRFRWQAARQGKATATVSGAYTLSGDALTLESGDRPPLRASLTERCPDSFRFKAAGDGPRDPGLGFRRVAEPSKPDQDQRGGPRENR